MWLQMWLQKALLTLDSSKWLQMWLQMWLQKALLTLDSSKSGSSRSTFMSSDFSILKSCHRSKAATLWWHGGCRHACGSGLVVVCQISV